MIGLVQGKIALIDGNYIIVETGGVGYKVLVPSKITSLKTGDELKLFTYTHVKEEALELFGFEDIKDLKLFENLINVNGVGPKTAMSLFSFSDREKIVEAIINGDVDFFTQVPRLGKKNAQKIIIELKNKFSDDSSFDLLEGDEEKNKDIIEALRSFGFSAKEAREALRNIDSKAETAEEKIKLALKYLGK